MTVQARGNALLTAARVDFGLELNLILALGALSFTALMISSRNSVLFPFSRTTAPTITAKSGHVYIALKVGAVPVRGNFVAGIGDGLHVNCETFAHVDRIEDPGGDKGWCQGRPRMRIGGGVGMVVTCNSC